MSIKSLLKRREASNALWIIMGKIAQSIIGLIINMLTARYLGPTNYGLIAYAASIVAFVVPIMTLGFNNVIVQELTNYPEEEGEIVGSSILLSIVSSFACIIGVSFYTFLVDIGQTVTNVVVVLYSVMLIFQAMELIQYWFQAKLLSKYMSLVSFFAYFVVAVYKIILLISGSTIYFFAISNALDYFLIACLLLIIYKKLDGKRLVFSKQIAKRMFSSSRHYIFASLMVTVFAQTDRIMIKLMIDETAVGYYSAAVTCAGLTSFVFSALIDSMRPSIFSHKKMGDLARYETNISRTYCMVIYLALIQSILMTVLSKYIIVILYGASYIPAVVVLRIVVWYTTFSYMGAVRNVWILGENKQKYLWILNLGGAIINILLNYMLIPLLGINGAAVASIITQAFTNVAMNVIVWPLRYNNRLILKGLDPRILLSLFK